MRFPKIPIGGPGGAPRGPPGRADFGPPARGPKFPGFPAPPGGAPQTPIFSLYLEAQQGVLGGHPLKGRF